MSSPFPGIDPYIETQLWEDFHGRFVGDIADALVELVRPKYVVRYERRVYVEHELKSPARTLIPDVSVLATEEQAASQFEGEQTASVSSAVNVVEVTLPMPELRKEAFLTVRERETMEVVTVIELLSPGNKQAGGDGRREYLRKRETVLESSANLIELDLLRGGKRLPTLESLPADDYFVFVCREKQRPRAEVLSWSLRQPLPAIPIPLAGDDSDVELKLQSLFSSRYDRSGYDYSLDYTGTLNPPFPVSDAKWIGEILKRRMDS